MWKITTIGPVWSGVPKRTTDGNTHRMVLRLEALLSRVGIEKYVILDGSDDVVLYLRKEDKGLFRQALNA